MCNYCDENLNECCIFQDPFTDKYYLNVCTYHWDDYDDDFDYIREYINFCPWCGRDLYKDERKE